MAERPIPTTQDVEFAYIDREDFLAQVANNEVDPDGASAAFRRWLAAHDARVKAEALREAAVDCAAAWLRRSGGSDAAHEVAGLITGTLMLHADQIEKGEHRD